MKPDVTTPEQARPGEDDLLVLELQIAQRADELWLSSGGGRSTDLIHWIRAEREVLDRYLEPAPPAAAGS